MTENPFLALAEVQISTPRKARLRAAEKCAARKAAAEREQLNAAWRQWQSERREKLLAGPYGGQFRSLIGCLENMTLESGAALIAAVEAGSWKDADMGTKFEVLALVDAAIIALRGRNGLPPFDDALPSERATVFQIVREALS